MLTRPISKFKFNHVFLGAVILITGILIGVCVFLRYDQLQHKNPYSYLNKNLINKKQVIKKTGYVVLRNKILDLIEVEKKAGRATTVAVYFRDLYEGPVFGINELTDFTPASLLKLPLVITYLNLEENNPGFIQRQIKYVSQPVTVQQTITSPVSLKGGENYKIEDLLFYTAAYSDNNSYLTLLQYLDILKPDKKLLLEIYQELGIIEPESSLAQTINVRSYAVMFRMLFNVAYLNEKLSNQLLAWLAQDNFKDGLVAGVPSDIQVAHKFGEREVSDEKNIFEIKQLHDCGIIYYPENPYLLCVMTRGKDLKELVDVIHLISKMTYEEINARKY